MSFLTLTFWNHHIPSKSFLTAFQLTVSTVLWFSLVWTPTLEMRAMPVGSSLWVPLLLGFSVPRAHAMSDNAPGVFPALSPFHILISSFHDENSRCKFIVRETVQLGRCTYCPTIKCNSNTSLRRLWDDIYPLTLFLEIITHNDIQS